MQQRTGRLSAAEIAAHPRSRAITGWLGDRYAPAAAARGHVDTFNPVSSGRLLVFPTDSGVISGGVYLVATVGGGGSRPTALAACAGLRNSPWPPAGMTTSRSRSSTSTMHTGAAMAKSRRHCHTSGSCRRPPRRFRLSATGQAAWSDHSQDEQLATRSSAVDPVRRVRALR